ncbi:MAG: hypothetical protein JXA67_15020 [Micromonosporaceae bacterium]|nr:hypothetical protein [Micromonosporaceae bacterium]
MTGRAAGGGSAWTAYLAQLRELHAVRSAAAERGESTEESLRARASQVEAFAERIRKQEKTVVGLAYDLRRPVRFVPAEVTDPAPSRPWDEAADDLEERLDTADRAIDEVRHYGHRPQLLPNWPDTARNAAIYFVLSLSNVFVNIGLWLFYVAGDDAAGTQFTAAAWGCCFWPIAVVIAGMVAIRTIGAPRLRPKPANEFEKATTTPAQLNTGLGFAISVGVSAASIGILWVLGTILSSGTA